MAKLDKPSVPHYWCEQKSSGWFDLWLSLEELLPLARECFSDNMRYFHDVGFHQLPPLSDCKLVVFYIFTSS